MIERRDWIFERNFHFILDLSTTNAASRPLSAPIVSSSVSDNDRSKDSTMITTDVTLSLKKNRSGEDKGKRFRI